MKLFSLLFFAGAQVRDFGRYRGRGFQNSFFP